MRAKRFKSFAALFFSAFLIFGVFNNIKIFAATDENYDMVKNCSTAKAWNVKFNMDVDKSTVNTQNIFVHEKDSTKNISITVSLDSSLKKISVKPVSSYTNGKTYILEITDKVKAKNGMNCKPYKIKFNVYDSAFLGLPAEDGIVIIDDIAYSAKYLINHKAIVNEIVTKGNYGVYYVQDYGYGYENVKSLFNTTDFTGKSYARKYNKITYVDQNGTRHAYGWNSKNYEYEEILPAADVSVISRSGIKLVSIKVSTVYGVPDAYYFKVEHSSDMKKIGDTVAFTTSYWGEVVTFYSKDKIAVAKGYVYVAYDNSKKYMLTLETSDARGNTPGNINNNGIAAMDEDGYVYYSNSSDKEKLYKMGFDGMYNVKLSDDKAQYINISNGWVYYSNYTDGGKLYKVKEDGSGRTKVVDDKAAYVTISGNDIYYSNHTDGGKLYRIKTDSSDVKKLTSGNLTGNKFSSSNDEIAYINIVGDWVYYTDVTDGNKLYLLNKEGIYKAKVADEWTRCVQISGNWIYYSSGSGVISKISMDGNGCIIPIKAKTKEYNKGYHLNAVGDWIYYSNYDDEGKLYKVKSDGSGEKIKLSDEDAGYINVLGDYVYFNTSKGKIFRVPLDSDGSSKPEELGAAKSSDKITLVEDVYVTIDYSDVNQSLKWLQDKYLPDKVPAIMGDNTMRQLVVAWDKDAKDVKMKDGVYTHTGTVVGYKNKIKCYLMIPSEMLNDTNDITVCNNPGKKDSVFITDKWSGSGTRLQEKDVVAIYSDETCKKLMGKGNVTREKKVLITGLDFNPLGQSIYITVQRVGKAPSKPTAVTVPDVPIIDATSAYDGDSIGLGADGRDFALKTWTKATFTGDDSFSPTEQYIYILPSKTQLDLLNNTAVDQVSISSEGPWKGDSINTSTGKSNIVRDSKLGLLKGGNYDIYVALGYSGTATPDVSGNAPKVTGKISSEYAAGLSVTEEYIPDKVVIGSMRVQPGSDITLVKAPKEGETAWIAPAGISWIAEKDGASPFNESDRMTMLAGDGVSKVIKAPQDTSVKEYKIYIVNSAAASPESTGSIYVDSLVPVVTTIPQSKSFMYAGDVLKVRSDKKGKVYILKVSNIINSVDDLEEAVRLKTANSVTITKPNLEYSLKTAGLEFEYTSNSYEIIAADEAGNLSNPEYTPITIVKDTADLEFMIDMAKKVSFTEDPLKTIQLSNAIKKAEDTLYDNQVTQKEIDNMAYQLKTTTIRLSGDSSLFKDWDAVLTAKRNIRITGEITYSDILGYIINKDKDEVTINLPTTYGTDIQIEWISDNDIISINADGTATVKIPSSGDIDAVVTLTASIRKTDSDIAVKKYVMVAVKARK